MWSPHGHVVSPQRVTEARRVTVRPVGQMRKVRQPRTLPPTVLHTAGEYGGAIADGREP
jgi:hypothetical protein